MDIHQLDELEQAPTVKLTEHVHLYDDETTLAEKLDKSVIFLINTDVIWQILV